MSPHSSIWMPVTQRMSRVKRRMLRGPPSKNPEHLLVPSTLLWPERPRSEEEQWWVRRSRRTFPHLLPLLTQVESVLSYRKVKASIWKEREVPIWMKLFNTRKALKCQNKTGFYRWKQPRELAIGWSQNAVGGGKWDLPELVMGEGQTAFQRYQPGYAAKDNVLPIM